MKNSPLKKRASVLFSAIFIAVVFLIVLLPLINWSMNEFTWTSRSFMSLKALNLADAGADLAAWEVIHNGASFAGWAGANPKTLTLSSFSDNGGTAAGDIAISCLNTSPGNYLVTSTGFVPNSTATTAQKTVKVKIFPHALFNNGIFAYTSVSLSGNTLVDSYNSASGPYTPLTAGSNGDVGTNGAFTISEDARVKGDIFIGPNGSVSGADSNVTGETFYSGNEVELVNPPLPDYFASLPNLGPLSVGGQQAPIIPTGNYIYESITVDGQSTLTLSNTAHIYVRTNVSVAGQASIVTNEGAEIYIGGSGNFAGQGIVNATANPTNLRIYGLSAGTTLNYAGLSDFYGTVYAPQSAVTMSGNASVFGAVVGNTVTLGGNIQFHYDEALTQNGPFSGYDTAYWQEN